MPQYSEDGDKNIEGLTDDEIFGLLDSERRRMVLEILNEKGSIDRHTLADRVASAENGKEIDELTDKERKRVQASLKQTHVIELRDLHVIQWDDPEIEKGPYFDDVYWYLENGPGQKSGVLSSLLDSFR